MATRAPRIAWLLRDLPVEILGLMRSDRVQRRRATSPRVYQLQGDWSSRSPVSVASK